MLLKQRLKRNINNWVRLLRPTQWTKNFIVFAGIIFARHLQNLGDFTKVLETFLIFTLLVSGSYIINDILDAYEDRRHPRKSKRPIASGAISPQVASWVGNILIVIALLWAYFTSRSLFLLTTLYLVIAFAYSFYLKHVVIIDVLALSLGFVIRAIAGVIVINVEISSWLLICTILLSLFLAISKRRFEFTLLEESALAHRPALVHYSPVLLDQMISVVTSAAFVSYCLYTLSPETVEKFGTKDLIFTIPFVIYGIFRYLYILYKKELADAPERALYTDWPLLIDILLWISVCILIIYIK